MNNAEQKEPIEEMNISQQLITSILNVSYLIKRERENILGKFGINYSKFNILQQLSNVTPDGLSQKEIREKLVDKTIDLSRLIQGLERGYFVISKRTKTDKKIAHITITPKGLKLLEQIRQHSAEMNKGTLDFTDTEMQHMLPKLEKMIAAFIKAPGKLEE